MEHTPTPWEREVAQDGEYTGPGDNPSGYIGDMYETNHVGWLDRETGEWIPVADFYRETDCIKALQAVNSHDALVEACLDAIAAHEWADPYQETGITKEQRMKEMISKVRAALKLAGVK